MTTSKDISACLTNCSGNGECSLDSNYNFYCACYEFYGGKTCNTDLRPCVSWPCMWNGNCSNIINGTSYDFECKCPYPYYGRHCHLKINLCQNVTCKKMQGTCQINGTIAECKCFTGFHGDHCELLSQEMQTVKTISNVTGVLAGLCLATFFGFFIFMDITKYGSSILEFIKLFLPNNNVGSAPIPNTNNNQITITDFD